MFRDIADDLDNYSLTPDTFLDVPFVPTDESAVEAMLSLAKVGPNDVLYDLGSGDGRILITAARDRDTRGIGIEVDPQRIADAMDEASWAGVECLVDFVEEDIFTADIREATVVTMYLLETVNLQLRPKLLDQLRPGTRVVSHAFDMADWVADDRLRVAGSNIYLWIIPAQIEGEWQWDMTDGTTYRLALKQRFQEITGKAFLGDQERRLERTRLRGNRLEVAIRAEGAESPDFFLLEFEENMLIAVDLCAPF
ncbi:SAM-dependent methyltransferase [Pararhodobacter oceanensis]|uniref:Class I SAM-dependent methyltransferase n=1 Tax=Pararhodobacter oceanensis TaxID=2172121 RepID=A0A2T8HRR7_9RHOB|nr:class I SAM-dependent methyltransferase [Pararhodobacter oceanensis]PVH28139.1 class I SAM-dependent methyltransferase [Pararhodobacter oceanensis]